MTASRLAIAVPLAGYLVLLVGIGLWMRRRQARFRDYVTGGGSIPAWMLAVSFFANFVSSNSFVGHAGKSYQVGLSWLGVAAIMVICCCLAWWWFAPRFARFAAETGASTLPDFFEHHWSRAVGRAAAAIVLAGTLFYVLAVMRGTAIVIQNGLEISYPAALVTVWGVTVVYCLFGGFWADVSTDVLQAFVLLLGAAVLFVALLVAAPPEEVATTPIRVPPVGLVVAVGLGGGLKLLSDPKQVMVFYAFRDDASARRFRIAGPLLLAGVYACLFPIGWLGRRFIAEAPDVESLVPRLVYESSVLPGALSSVFLAAVLAASMSSLDSALLVMASCAEKHFVARGEPSIGRTRAILAVVASLALALSLRPLGGIIELTTFAGALVGSALMPSIVAGLAGVRVRSGAALFSIVGGVAGTVAGHFLAPRTGTPWVQDVFVGLSCGTLPLLLPWSRRR